MGLRKETDSERASRDNVLTLPPSSGSLLGQDSLMLLDSLLPAVAELSPEMIDLNKKNIDGISLLGRWAGFCYLVHQRPLIANPHSGVSSTLTPPNS